MTEPKLHRNESGTDSIAEQEVIVLLRNTPILIGRQANLIEIGFATGVFCYWYLGFAALSPTDKEMAAWFFLNDSRFCLRVACDRLWKTIPAPAPSDQLETYFANEVADCNSFLGSVNQSAHILAESYLNTLGLFQPKCYWESMPQIANLGRRQCCATLMQFAARIAPSVPDIMFPQDVIHSQHRLDDLGHVLSQGFLVVNAPHMRMESAGGIMRSGLDVRAYHYCPAINRIESTGWNNRADRTGSCRPEVPVKWGFSRKGSH